jgi:hypothetical protein
MKDRVQCDERDCEARVMTREIEGQLLGCEIKSSVMTKCIGK